MLRSWLDYIAQNEPAALQPGFWQRWAATRIEQHDKLGLGLRDHAPGSARVEEVMPGSPAASYLRPGDVIVAVGGRRLVTRWPAREVAEAYTRAAGSGRFALTIRRDNQTHEVAIPLEPPLVGDPGSFDPVGAVRTLAEFAAHIDTLVLWRQPSPAGRDAARMRVSWRRPAQP
jgi:hypothetical protein